MHFFHQLLAIVLVTLLAVLGWDLGQRCISHGDKETIIYAGMFGPGEQMQLLYSGPPPQLEAEHPLGPDAMAHYAALMQAWPDLAQQVRDGYRRVFQRDLASGTDAHDPPYTPDATASSPASTEVGSSGGQPSAQQGGSATTAFQQLPLVERYRQLDRVYVEQLIETIGQKARGNRLVLFRAFAEKHPQHDRDLIAVFQSLHPAYRVGLFEDFRRRYPQYEIEERWDGRWVLSANRPRFLTGTDVPDIVAGSLLELRILYQENLALPLDQPLPDAENPIWREKGILYEPACNDPNTVLKDTFHPWALEASRYTVTEMDVTRNQHPYPAGTRIVYLWPSIVHSNVVFYNRAHFRRIGRDGDAVPQTVEEFETICRQLRDAGIEPIAQDGTTYIEMWWNDLVNRTVGYETFRATCSGEAPRFAGPDADPRYLEIAKRLRSWRDQGFWMQGFSASKWPGAQRDFGTGRCTFLFTGTWLPAEISQTRSYDPAVFDLSCFMFPAEPRGAGNPRQIGAASQGHVITRQGRNHEGAAALLNYLSVYGAEPQATQLDYISAHKGVPFPASVEPLRQILDEARPGDIITDGINGELPMFFKFVLIETFNKFFPVRSDDLSPEQFVQELERKSQEHYVKYGKGT